VPAICCLGRLDPLPSSLHNPHEQMEIALSIFSLKRLETQDIMPMVAATMPKNMDTAIPAHGPGPSEELLLVLDADGGVDVVGEGCIVAWGVAVITA
jgi:hypothetical protein